MYFRQIILDRLTLVYTVNPSSISICPGCAVVLPYQEKLAHYQTAGIARYGVASAECAALFGEILHYERALFGYTAANRLIVDAYAVQHPPHYGHQKNRSIKNRFIDASIQSVSIHLIALYCSLVEKRELHAIAKIMATVLTTMKHQNVSFPPLTPPSCLGNIKVTDVHTSMLETNLSLDQYTALAYQWAEASWNAWAFHHASIEELYEKYSKT